MPPVPDAKQPFYVHCGDCGYEWIAFYVPIAIRLMKHFCKSPCPKCVSRKVLCGKQPDVLIET